MRIYPISLTPYSYNTMLSPDYTIQKAAGDIFANAVRLVYGEIFTVGSSANLLCKIKKFIQKINKSLK